MVVSYDAQTIQNGHPYWPRCVPVTIMLDKTKSQVYPHVYDVLAWRRLAVCAKCVNHLRVNTDSTHTHTWLSEQTLRTANTYA
jgi:hypothetical protein